MEKMVPQEDTHQSACRLPTANLLPPSSTSSSPLPQGVLNLMGNFIIREITNYRKNFICQVVSLNNLKKAVEEEGTCATAASSKSAVPSTHMQENLLIKDLDLLGGTEALSALQSQTLAFIGGRKEVEKNVPVYSLRCAGWTPHHCVFDHVACDYIVRYNT